MDNNRKREIRDYIGLVSSLLFSWLYLPHLVTYGFGKQRKIINGDLDTIRHQIKIRKKLPHWLTLLFFLHHNSYYRSFFYYRIGPVKSLFIRWLRPSCKTFIIPYSTKIGKNLWFAHPYSTVLNAASIGDNFKCIHCVTIGTKEGMKAAGGRRPVIGDNVSVGCHACIIGPVTIGNNVTIGAGCVVVKDIPDNCTVVGNPARILKKENHQ